MVGCSNMFYGTPNNLLLPGLARTMGEGWETARRRDDGNDWVMVRLGLPGLVRLVELDTTHFKGNAPGEAGSPGSMPRESAVDDPAPGSTSLPRTRLQPDTRHRFRVGGRRGRPTSASTPTPTAAWRGFVCLGNRRRARWTTWRAAGSTPYPRRIRRRCVRSPTGLNRCRDPGRRAAAGVT